MNDWSMFWWNSSVEGRALSNLPHHLLAGSIHSYHLQTCYWQGPVFCILQGACLMVLSCLEIRCIANVHPWALFLHFSRIQEALGLMSPLPEARQPTEYCLLLHQMLSRTSCILNIMPCGRQNDMPDWAISWSFHLQYIHQCRRHASSHLLDLCAAIKACSRCDKHSHKIQAFLGITILEPFHCLDGGIGVDFSGSMKLVRK